MKTGVLCPFGAATPPERIAATGRAVEERGFASIWVPEHVVLFREHASRYPYSADGRIPGRPTQGPLDPFTALAFLAAHTARVRLGTGICLVPQRPPVYTAKLVADVDFLSRGRADFGIGIGWLREEFEALGVPWRGRAARTRDYLGVMKALWCEEVSSYRGPFYTLPECIQSPKPVQKPHPPLLFGGESDAALRRVADLGQGWFGYQVSPADLPAALQKLDKLLAERGRTRAEVRIVIAPPPRADDPDSLARYRDLGVAELVFPLVGRDEADVMRRLDEIAARALR
jgi:probable F420-dependent oxidoreductase